ncbi:MAG: EAL domain-containing protein [Lachnospiraceae bacterium]|nr:EAL domain-containing protein [Lachnospiraceae bacterium]
MNIYTQCCGILLLLVLVWLYRHQKRLHLNTGKAFLLALTVALCSLVLDALSVVMISNMDSLPLFFVNFSCKTYLSSQVAVALCTVCYICTDIYTKRIQYYKVVNLNVALSFAAILLIYILPISIYNDPVKGEIYTYGPSVMVAYISAVFYLISNLVLLVRKKNVIRLSRRKAMMFWMLIWIGGALIQFFHNEILIVGFASSIGIMVLYIKLENPEVNLDRQTGLFNQTALTRYVRQLSYRSHHFSLVLLVLEHSFYKNISKDSKETETAAEMEMIDYLSVVPGAMVFKTAGDEIMLLFENERKAEESLAVLRKRFERGWGKDESVFQRPFWIHLPDSSVMRDVKDVSHLIKHVRQNSKELIENGYLRIDKAIAEEMYRTREMESIIFNAIEQNWITVYYQPIYSTEEDRFTSAEALVRITDEDGRVVPPYDFVWVAERNGMMLRLGEIIFEKVCQFIRDSKPEQYGIEYIEVNLSAIQCAYERFADNYIAIMEKYGVRPEFINLEITETATMGAKKIALENMRKLIEYGVSFSLDDFGTGQSNLNYIVEMPVKIVKFDRTMINAYFENGKAKYVMDAAMHMIHGMGLEIVSEGIETKEMYDTMCSLGISYIQGYYFSRPIPEQDFLEFLKAKKEGKRG